VTCWQKGNIASGHLNSDLAW